MAEDSALKRLAAFAAAMLLVVWIGGVCGAGLYKAVYYLLFGAWPNTALYGLAPGPVLAFALTRPEGDWLRPWLLAMLQTDVYVYILLLPPVLFLPCLAVFLFGSGQGPLMTFQTPRFPPLAPGMAPRIDPIFRRNRGLKA